MLARSARRVRLAERMPLCRDEVRRDQKVTANEVRRRCAQGPPLARWHGLVDARLDRHGAARIVRRAARRAGIIKPVGLHTLRARSFTAAVWTPGSRCATCRTPRPTPIPRTTMRYDRARCSLDRHATYIVAAYVAGAAR